MSPDSLNESMHMQDVLAQIVGAQKAAEMQKLHDRISAGESAVTALEKVVIALDGRVAIVEANQHTPETCTFIVGLQESWRTVLSKFWKLVWIIISAVVASGSLYYIQAHWGS